MKLDHNKLLLGIVAIVAASVVTAAATPAPGQGSSKLRRWTSIPYDHVEVALFSIYGPFERAPDAATLRNAKSALDVFDFQEVVLAEDDKGLSFRLSDQERRVLARLAQTHPGAWFVAAAPRKDVYKPESSIAMTRMTPEMAGGQIVFPHPQCAAIAQSLRRRLRLAEFRTLSR